MKQKKTQEAKKPTDETPATITANVVDATVWKEDTPSAEQAPSSEPLTGETVRVEDLASIGEPVGEITAGSVATLRGVNTIGDEERKSAEKTMPKESSPQIGFLGETVTVDKKAFAKLIYSLVIGQPSNYLRHAAIPRLGDLFHIEGYQEQVEIWNKIKEYHSAG